ncbi:hypothetical protein C0995_007514, partial [Termitomyces sp. Mi166
MPASKNWMLFIFASHNVLAIDENSLSYKLLGVFRKYVNIVMWENLEVHTSKTIVVGQKAFEAFEEAFQAYDAALAEALPDYTDDNPDTGNMDSDSDTNFNDSGADIQPMCK